MNRKQRDAQLIKLVKNSYKSLRVVGRGTIMIDPREVVESPEFKAARELARKIVKP